MNERDLMEDVLLVLKGAADLYLHGTIESSTLNVHTTFEKVLNDTLCMQNVATKVSSSARMVLPIEY